MVPRADLVLGHAKDADHQREPPLTQPRVALEAGEARETLEMLKRPLSELERYAGWLPRDHVSIAVRADVHALCAAMDAGHDTSPLLLTLDKDLGRLPGGDIRKMLRKTLAEIRAVLGPSGTDVRDKEGS